MTEIIIPIAVGHQSLAEEVSLKIKVPRTYDMCLACSQQIPLQENEYENSWENYQRWAGELADFMFKHCCGGFTGALRDQLLARYEELEAAVRR